MTVNNLEYFLDLDSDQLADAMKDKINKWREYCSSSGFIGLWQKKLSNYYGRSQNGNTSQAVVSGGAEGELNLIKVNDLHSLLQGQLVMVTGQRPAAVARAVSADTKSLKASKLGSAVSEYYLDIKGFEKAFLSATEMALLCDEGFTDVFWDKSLGHEVAVDPETGSLEMSGDLIMRYHGPWNVARDPGLTIEAQKWYILSYKVNKFDMAKLYPKFAEKIISCGTGDNTKSISLNHIPEGSDAIFVHLLVAEKTSSCPRGRYSLLIGDWIVLDMELPFESTPIDRISAADILDGVMGYSASNDIIGLEDVTDALHSIVTTNETKFGGNTIVGPSGVGINWNDLAKGSRYIELPPDMVDKLQSLQLSKTAPEIFGYIEKLDSKKEQAVGSNSVVRGQPSSDLSGSSGSALALIQAQSVSFNSGIQKAYYKLLSSGMSKAVAALAKYVSVEMLVPIVGKAKAAGIKEFKYVGKDLNAVSSIVFEMVNPMSQTFGGRLTFAQDLLKAGQIKSPKQYITVATTGQTESMTQDDEQDQMLILEENEWLMEGKPFKPIITQMHEDHIRSHTSQITLDAQVNNPEMVVRVLEHIQGHIDLWMNASLNNPGILLATNQRPLMPPQGMLPPAGPGQTPGQPPGPPQGASDDQMGPAQNPAQDKAQEVRMPSMPTVAGTDEKAVVPGVPAL